jgi:hypothetical protein
MNNCIGLPKQQCPYKKIRNYYSLRCKSCHLKFCKAEIEYIEPNNIVKIFEELTLDEKPKLKRTKKK